MHREALYNSCDDMESFMRASEFAKHPMYKTP